MASEAKAKLIRALPGAGHFSVAVLYVTTGLLAALLAFGMRREAPDVRGVIRVLKEQPFGPALLFLVALGSICLVVWRLLQAFVDVEDKGRTLVGLFQRARYLFGACLYLGLPILIFRMFAGTSGRSGDQAARELVSRVIGIPFGWTLVVLVGLCLLGSGGYCAYQTIFGRFDRWFHCEEMSPLERTLCLVFGRLGYAGRGALLLVIGYFVINAGWNLNPRQVEGQAGAMHTIVRQPFGPVLLGIVAVGLISFGIFSLLASRYGKVPVQRVHEALEMGRARAAA